MTIDGMAKAAVGALDRETRERLRDMVRHDGTTATLRDALDGSGVPWYEGWHDEETGEHVVERGATSVEFDGCEYTFFDSMDGMLETRAVLTAGQAARFAERLCLGR